MGTYAEGERVFGPPQGSFDPEWVAAIAAERHPSLALATATALAAHTWRHLRASPQLSPDDLVAYVTLDEPEVALDVVGVVVGATLDFVETYAVEPPPITPEVDR